MQAMTDGMQGGARFAWATGAKVESIALGNGAAKTIGPKVRREGPSREPPPFAVGSRFRRIEDLLEPLPQLRPKARGPTGVDQPHRREVPQVDAVLVAEGGELHADQRLQ